MIEWLMERNSINDILLLFFCLGMIVGGVIVYLPLSSLIKEMLNEIGRIKLN